MTDFDGVQLFEGPHGYVLPEPEPTWRKYTTCPSVLPRVDYEFTIPWTYPIPDFVHPDDFVQVHDAKPMPGSKDQCKNGGHASFGFKNQGECVAFVERRPKPKP